MPFGGSLLCIVSISLVCGFVEIRQNQQRIDLYLPQKMLYMIKHDVFTCISWCNLPKTRIKPAELFFELKAPKSMFFVFFFMSIPNHEKKIP